MAKNSHLEIFQGGDFSEFAERLTFHFLASDIGKVPPSAKLEEKQAAIKKQAAVLVTHLSPSVYSVLKSLCLPESPIDKSFSELSDLLKNYYKPNVSTVSATYSFQQCRQQDLSVVDFANKLKRLAEPCKFDAHYDRALRDRASVAWKPGRRSSLYLSRRAKPSLMFTSSHWRKKLPRKQRIRSRRPSLTISPDLQRRRSMASAKNFVVTVPADEVPRRHARRVNKLQGNPATVVTDMATLPQSAFTSRPNVTSAVRRVMSSKPVGGNGEPPRTTWRRNLTNPVSVNSQFSMSMSTTQALLRTNRILPM